MFPSTSKKNLRPGSGSPAPSVIDRLNAESEKPASADVPFEDNPGTQTGRISSGDAVTSNVPKADEPLLTLPLRQQRDILLRAAKELIARKERYASYQSTFAGRNSFSKTDPDATFMHMKEDHMPSPPH